MTYCDSLKLMQCNPEAPLGTYVTNFFPIFNSLIKVKKKFVAVQPDVPYMTL